MSPFWALSLLAALLSLTVVPLVLLDGGPAYWSLLLRHPVLLGSIGLAWAACLNWALRRVAEFLLLRRSGAKLRTDA